MEVEGIQQARCILLIALRRFLRGALVLLRFDGFWLFWLGLRSGGHKFVTVDFGGDAHMAIFAWLDSNNLAVAADVHIA